MGKKQTRKRKRIELPVPTALSEDDIEYLLENEDYVRAMSRIDEQKLMRRHIKQKSKDQAQDSDSEIQEYKHLQKKLDEAEIISRLPIKTMDGKLLHLPARKEPFKTEIMQEYKRTAETPIIETNTFDQIAQNCTLVISDPEKNMNLLEGMQKRLKSLDNLKFEYNILIMAICQVYLDIIPGYRISELTETQKSEKVAKSTHSQRHFEDTLILLYRQYLEVLEKTHTKTSIKVFNVLFKQHYDFNYREKLLSNLCRAMTCPEYRQEILETFKDVFQNDQEGAATADTVEVMAARLKTVSFVAHRSILDLFKELPLKQELSIVDINAPKSFEKLGKRASKRARVEAQVLASIRESEAKCDLKRRKAHQRRALERVFAVYTRILRDYRGSPLLGACLVGLLEYAHLVNLDLFDSIFHLLNALANDPKTVAANRLLAAHTGCVLIRQVNGNYRSFSGINDTLAFHACVFQEIGRQSECGVPGKHLKTCLLVLDDLTTGRVTGGKVPASVVAAHYLRVLAAAAAAVEPASAMACLAWASAMTAHAAVRALFESISSRPAMARFEIDADDPEKMNATSGAAFAIALLKRHWHPQVRKATIAMCNHVKNTNSF